MLRLQKIFGPIAADVRFPRNVRYGNIIKGLPVKPSSCLGVYSSHTLEHLSLEDCRIALRNTRAILAPGGIFRCIVPDLRVMVNEYVESGDAQRFISDTLMGTITRPRKMKDRMRLLFGNDRHLWMWDYEALSLELRKAGFRDIRQAQYGDCTNKMFALVEDPSRFVNAVAIECRN